MSDVPDGTVAIVWRMNCRSSTPVVAQWHAQDGVWYPRGQAIRPENVYKWVPIALAQMAPELASGYLKMRDKLAGPRDATTLSFVEGAVLGAVAMIEKKGGA